MSANGRIRRRLGTQWQRGVEWFNALGLSENAVLLVFGVAIGIVGALGVAVFYGLIDASYALFYRAFDRTLPQAAGALHRPILTAAALFAAWWLMQRFGAGHDGLNIPDVQLAVARRAGHIPTGPALARTAASAVTIGGGGSAGSEGPVAVLGATVGSVLGRSFRFDAARMRVLVGAGVAAGISAAFGAPLTGAFFALEQILGSLAVGAFPPVVVSAVVAAVLSQTLFGAHPGFPIPLDHGQATVPELVLLYPLLGVATAAMGVFFIRAYYGVQDLVRASRLPAAAVAALGGFGVGVLVLGSGGLLVGSGHLALPPGLFGGMAWWALAALALGKGVATALTLSTGGSGGLFTPALYMGAATGGSFGVAAAALLPGMVADPEVYALVGMGAVLVAALDAPLTGILIVFELTNDYAIVPPLMLTTMVSLLVARRFQRDSLYSLWLRKRGERIEHGTDRAVLGSLRVADAFDPDPQVIGQTATVSQLMEHLGRGGQTDFPVVDGDLKVVGMVSVSELGRIARDHADLIGVLMAADVAAPVDPVHPGDSLFETIRRMGARGVSTLPVVEGSTRRLLGVIDRGHVLAVYERTIAGQET